MSVRVINAGSSVRLILQARSVVSTAIIGGYLIVAYSDGTTETAGYVDAGGGVVDDLYVKPGYVADGYVTA